MPKQKSKPVYSYLVVVRTNLDELPILLTSDRSEAIRKANKVTDRDAERSAEMMGVDSAGRINIAIIAFRNGKPTSIELIKDWENEDSKKAA